MAVPEDLQAQLDALRTTRNNYLLALTSDSISPQPNYSMDGESVSRDEWRANLFQLVKDTNELICLLDPFEFDTVQT